MQTGFSLVELMVALLIGAVVLGAVGKLFVASQQAYLLQGAADFLQEDMRIVAGRLSQSLRMADFWGGNAAASVQMGNAAASVKGRGRCNGSWVTDLTAHQQGGGGVAGFDGGDNFPFDATCIGGSANYVRGSDVLVVRYADASILSPGPVPAASPDITKNPAQVFVLSAPSQFASLFTGTVPKHPADQVRAYAYAYRFEMFYLRPCHVLVANASVCSAAADAGSPLPTLMHLSLQSDGTLVSEPLAEGIEQIVFEYGVPGSADSDVPVYYRAGAISAEQWARVVSVRVSLVAVSPTRDIAVPHDADFVLGALGRCHYAITANGFSSNACSGLRPFGDDKPWQFLRAKQEFVVQLRNRSKG